VSYGEPKRARNWKRWILPRGYLQTTLEGLLYSEIPAASTIPRAPAARYGWRALSFERRCLDHLERAKDVLRSSRLTPFPEWFESGRD
jgi:hypothetical protein